VENRNLITVKVTDVSICHSSDSGSETHTALYYSLCSGSSVPGTRAGQDTKANATFHITSNLRSPRARLEYVFMV